MSRYERQEKSKKKHPIVSSSTPRNPSGAPKTTQPSQRPGWRGPGFSKKSKSSASGPAGATAAGANSSKDEAEQQQPPAQRLTREQQQQLLGIFRTTFPASADPEGLKPTLQSIKSALHARDFARAFGSRAFLEAYALRWSPSRALCYAEALARLADDFPDDPVFSALRAAGAKPQEPEPEPAAGGVVCLGGGAAEVVAVAGLLRYLDATPVSAPGALAGAEHLVDPSVASSFEGRASAPRLHLHLVDSAPWDGVVTQLSAALTAPAPLSKYASAAARAANAPLLPPGSVALTFTPRDLLDTSRDDLAALVARGHADDSGDGSAPPTLITLLFTLNELYAASLSRTTLLLLHLTAVTAPGTLLLVIDSPGSYSEAPLGSGPEGSRKRYPMQWLLDHALLEQQQHVEAGKEQPSAWKKLVGDESRWFRLPEGLKYPLSLENMRFQMHLFRRV
ncbi:MAG: hypothetical protein M1818_004192 [Claussenomyces sp. TS43310]|nr:MAG: hypothetical protein M1818_004192 [Claussenomyces sp. TS43310]